MAANTIALTVKSYGRLAALRLHDRQESFAQVLQHGQWAEGSRTGGARLEAVRDSRLLRREGIELLDRARAAHAAPRDRRRAH